MERGTYAAASAGLVQMTKLEVQNNNLANLNTAGFKRQFITTETQSFDKTFAAYLQKTDPYAKPDADRTPGVTNVKTVTDFSAGPVQATGNPFDVALKDANDFFVINTPDGPQYTRAGNFTLNASGEIVTQDGYQVIGDGGPIAVTGPGPTIEQDGSVRAGGETLGKLQTVHFDDPSQLERVGSTRFKLGQGQAAPQDVDGNLVPRSLEMSNVSAVTSMIDLITTNRAFEAYTKAAQTIDGLNQSAISQVGKRQ